MTTERRRVEIVDSPEKRRNLSPRAEAFLRIYNLQKELGAEGGDFIHELLKQGITPNNISNNVDELVEIVGARSISDSDYRQPKVTKKGGKKFFSIPVGSEQINTEFRPYEPPQSSSDLVQIEKITFGQRILGKIFKR